MIKTSWSSVMAAAPTTWLTGGGPSNSTYTVVYDIYETGTVNWEIGLASTMAIVFVFFVMILTVIQTIATRDKEDQNVNKKAKKK